MNDTEQKARDMVRKEGRGHLNYDAAIAALCRVIEQHEAFRREVSDAVSQYADEFVPADLQRFIIAAPKPDSVRVLFEHLEATENFYPQEFEQDLRAALAARGLKIVESE